MIYRSSSISCQISPISDISTDILDIFIPGLYQTATITNQQEITISSFLIFFKLMIILMQIINKLKANALLDFVGEKKYTRK